MVKKYFRNRAGLRPRLYQLRTRFNLCNTIFFNARRVCYGRFRSEIDTFEVRFDSCIVSN